MSPMCMQCVATGMTYAGLPLSSLYARAVYRGRHRGRRASVGAGEDCQEATEDWAEPDLTIRLDQTAQPASTRRD
jgi:hypothetical protein